MVKRLKSKPVQISQSGATVLRSEPALANNRLRPDEGIGHILQPNNTQQSPCFGIWKSREYMKDAQAWVTKARKPRKF